MTYQATAADLPPGSVMRFDYDAPEPGQAYVIRIEGSDGHRLKAIVADREIEGKAGPELLWLLESKAKGVAIALLSGQGHEIPGAEVEIR